jgi:hypothetical protein
VRKDAGGVLHGWSEEWEVSGAAGGERRGEFRVEEEESGKKPGDGLDLAKGETHAPRQAAEEFRQGLQD